MVPYTLAVRVGALGHVLDPVALLLVPAVCLVGLRVEYAGAGLVVTGVVGSPVLPDEGADDEVPQHVGDNHEDYHAEEPSPEGLVGPHREVQELPVAVAPQAP